MKKNLTYLLILILLCALGYWLYRNSNDVKIDPERDFAIEDTESIYKFVIKDKRGHEVTLEKKDNIWLVNNYRKANDLMIKAFLETIKDLHVELNVPDQARKNVIKDMSYSSVKASFYDEDGDEIKSIYVGKGGTNSNGTYMILEHDQVIAPNPYIVNIPGFQGYLTPRFTADSIDWRNTQVFGTPYEQISQVKIEYFEKPEGSFVMNVNEELVQISPIHDSLINKGEIDDKKVVSFLAEFESKHIENYILGDTLEAKIRASTPYCRISCTNNQSKTDVITLYRMPRTDRSYMQKDAQGNVLEYDIEHYYAVYGEHKDFVSVQYYVFGVLLKKYNSFFKAKEPEK